MKKISRPQFFNRELSWLEFNDRVLSLAFDTAQPLLERVKFLAITASNLDEFLMVRVGGLQASCADSMNVSKNSSMKTVRKRALLGRWSMGCPTTRPSTARMFSSTSCSRF